MDVEDAINEARKQAVDEWLAMNWTTLAAEAWARYRKSGAGALAVCAEDIEADPPAPQVRIAPIRYISRARLRCLDSHVWRGALDVVDRYDPQREVVVLVLYEDIYLANKTAGVPTPPQAFALSEDANDPAKREEEEGA